MNKNKKQAQKLAKKKSKNNILTNLMPGKGLPAPEPRPCRITVQDSVPIIAVHDQYNLIEPYPGFYSKTFKIGENNYQMETAQSQNLLLTQYRTFLNTLGESYECAITILNKKINMELFRETMMKKETGDKYDYLRRELNDMMETRLEEGRNGLEKVKYITVGVHEQNARKANEVFAKTIDNRINSSFQKIMSSATPLKIEDRMELIHDIYNPDAQGEFMSKTKIAGADGSVQEVSSFDFANVRSMGCTITDMIGPTSLQFGFNYIRMGRKYARVMRVTELPSNLNDEFFVSVSDVNFPVMVTVNVQPIPSKKGSIIAKNALAAAQSIKIDAIKRNPMQPEDLLAPEIQEQVDKAKELLTEMGENDEKLFKTTYTVLFWADSKEELDEYTEILKSNCAGATVTLSTMDNQQEIGLNATLPLCDNEIPYRQRRTLKSSSCATVCMPFSHLELCQPSGINYSMHLFSKSPIIYDRLLAANANGFIFGKSGSGKSFTAKIEMINVLLGSDADVIVIDPEAEYGAICKLLGGQNVKLVPGGKSKINPIELTSNYEWVSDTDIENDEPNPIYAKAAFLLHLMEFMINKPFGLDSIQKTIIDEALHTLYAPYIDENGNLLPIPAEKMPTLTDLAIEIGKSREPEARELAMGLRLYTTGSQNIFGQQSTVDITNRFTVFNIRETGDELKPIAMLIIMDYIQNKLFENQRRGRNTWLYVDECHLLLKDDRTADFLASIWKRARKYMGVPTGITQEVSDVLNNDTAAGLIKNCNFVQMLNQEANEREKLADMLQMSEAMQDVLTNAVKGQGVIYTGEACVPFYAKFPKERKDGTPNPIYMAITSTQKEILEYQEAERQKKFAERKRRIPA